MGKGLRTKVNASIGEPASPRPTVPDFICYVTPAEHLALPNIEDVRQGVITARIAAHIGDMIKNGSRDKDLAMGRARRDMLWDKQFELALDPVTARKVRSERAPQLQGFCTIAGLLRLEDHKGEHLIRKVILKGSI